MIRYMDERAVIHMAKEGEPLPFDIKDYRAIFYRLDHPSALDKARKELAEQVHAVEAPGYKVSNPITRARGHRDLARSSDPKDKLVAGLISKVESIDGDIGLLTVAVTDLDRRMTALPSITGLGALRAAGAIGFMHPSLLGGAGLDELTEPVGPMTSEIVDAPSNASSDKPTVRPSEKTSDPRTAS